MSRRGTTPNPLPLGSFPSPFAQFTTQNQPVYQQPKHRPNSLAPKPSPLSKSPAPSATTLSVEEWEAKAPLNDLQIRSISSVKRAAEYTRIPDKVRYHHSRVLVC